MDQDKKQVVNQFFSLLRSENQNKRLEGLEGLGALDFSHPQIINALTTIEKTDPDAKVRAAATKALNSPPHSKFIDDIPVIEPNPQQIAARPNAITERPGDIDLQNYFKTQERMLHEINNNLVIITNWLDVINKRLKYVEITNVDMPFLAMVGFAIKWLIAGIPAGILVGIMLFFLSACTAGLL